MKQTIGGSGNRSMNECLSTVRPGVVPTGSHTDRKSYRPEVVPSEHQSAKYAEYDALKQWQRFKNRGESLVVTSSEL